MNGLRMQVRVPLWMAHKLHHILELYASSGRLAKMQRVRFIFRL